MKVLEKKNIQPPVTFSPQEQMQWTKIEKKSDLNLISYILIYNLNIFRRFLHNQRKICPESKLTSPNFFLLFSKYLDDNFKIQRLDPFQICKGYQSNSVLTCSQHSFHQDSLVLWRCFRANLLSPPPKPLLKITANLSLPDPWILNDCYPENTNWWWAYFHMWVCLLPLLTVITTRAGKLFSIFLQPSLCIIT